MGHPYQIFDVFTDEPLAGNPLAVVFDADDLSTEGMQRIAREFNLSETVFFRAPTEPRYTARMRIFTPVSEMPFAGHPTVGGAVAFALARGDHDDVVALELGAGPVMAAVEVDGNGGTAAFDAPLVPKVLEDEVDAGAVARALGLAAADIGFDGLVPVSASSGPAFTVVPVSSPSVLERIALDRRAWAQAFPPPLSAAFCIARSGPSAFRARMFAPLQGIEEDPATGSAAVAFAAVLGPKEAEDGIHVYNIEQGVEMGRRSLIHLEVEMEKGQISRVRLSGHAVRLAEGTLHV